MLVADHAPTRLGVRLALAGQVEICAEVDSFKLALAAARELRPKVCLIGCSLPGGGLNAVREICRSVPESAVIMLSDGDGDGAGDLVSAVRAGAVGYVPAGFDADSLRRALRSVLAEEAAVPRSMVLDLVNELRHLQRASEEHLTLREAEILSMLRRGKSTTVIASSLDISSVTVRRHISKLMQKAGVGDRDELMRVASEPNPTTNANTHERSDVTLGS